MKLNYDKIELYKAHLSRDQRFDGKFFVAVKTTKIYCRPTCPARKAKLENLEFYIHAFQAEKNGYRPCIRCRPETAPGSAAWVGTSAVVKRALRIMDTHALEKLSINNLATKLGISDRHLRKLFQQQVGISPQAILLSKKLDIARNLLYQSNLSITDIAFNSGFNSIRRFNDAFKTRFNKVPSALRSNTSTLKQQINLELSYRPPYAWNSLLNFFKNRLIPEMELVTDTSYERLISLDQIRGWFKVTFLESNKINIEFRLNKNANLIEFITRIKNIFDLDCDPMAIESMLMLDPKLTSFVKKFNGLRIPGSWDGFELAIRALIGQRISVKVAHTILNKIVNLCGEEQFFDDSLKLKRFFPTPENILNADLAKIGLPTSKIETIRTLAKEVINNNIILDGTADFNETCQKLLQIKGIGPWTVEYIAMRALRDPNSFPLNDLELQKKVIMLKLDPSKWVPWRSYAAILLWNINLKE